MNNRILIMAQGQGSRWCRDGRVTTKPPCEYKQVLSITSKENLISRTIRQLDYDPLIKVICTGKFYHYLPDGTEIESFQEPVGSILHGVWNTKREWGWYDQILIILGDVAFSNIAMKRILTNDQKLAFFGRLGENLVTGKKAREIFAVSIRKDKYVEVIDNLKILWSAGKQKLWDYYETYEPNFVEINDYTDDIDDLMAYQKFWPMMKEKIIEDDNRFDL